MRPKRDPDFRVLVHMANGYVFQHAFSQFADARLCYERTRVHAFLGTIDNVQLFNGRDQCVICEALTEFKDRKPTPSARGLDR